MEKVAEVVAQTTEQLFDRAYVPVFFQKLAQDFGIEPKSQEEQIELLKLALDLQAKGVEPTSKTENDARVSVVKEARAAINPELSLHENAANGLVNAFVSNPEILKLAKTNLLAQMAMIQEQEEKK